MDASIRQWVEAHFASAPLGDARRGKRLVKLAAAFAASAGGTIPSVTRCPHQAKAAYRLLDREELTHEAVVASHVDLVRQATAAPGEYLLIEDTTSLNYQGLEGCQGLGPIGEGYTRGLWMHTCLALRVDWQSGRQELLGMLGQRLWARPPQPPGAKAKGKAKENDHDRQRRPHRESARWAEALAAAQGPLPGTRWIYVADRESDIYEVFQSCWALGASYVIRAAQPRALGGELAAPGTPAAPGGGGLDLFTAAAQAPERGRVRVELPDGTAALLEVRSTPLTLRGPRRPGGRLEDHDLSVVEARQVDAPAGAPGAEPLHWVVLTDLPVGTLAQCQRVLAIYRRRPLIEEFHKALKTGLKIEASQLSSARRLMALAGVLSVVAVFLLNAKLAASTDGEAPLSQDEVDATTLAVLRKVDPPAQGGPTRRWLWVSIAKLGGFLARKGDGGPGWLTIWRGWQTLMVLVRGYELANTS